MKELVVKDGKAIILEEKEAELMRAQEKAKEQELLEGTKKEKGYKYEDVTGKLNIVNSKLGYVMPKDSHNIVEVVWKDVDYKALANYHAEMDKLQAKFDKLKEGQSSGKYTDAFLGKELRDIQEKAKQYLVVAKLDIELMKEETYNNPTVREKLVLNTDAYNQAQVLSKANTIALTQSIISTGDLSMIDALLTDNIANNEVRLLVSNYLTNHESKEGTLMKLAIKKYEDKVKNKEQLELIGFKYEKIDRVISQASYFGRQHYPKFFIDEDNFLQYYNFSKKGLSSKLA